MKEKHEWTPFPEPSKQQRRELSHHYDGILGTKQDRNGSSNDKLDREQPENREKPEKTDAPKELSKDLPIKKPVEKPQQKRKKTGKNQRNNKKSSDVKKNQKVFDFSELVKELESKKFLKITSEGQDVLVRFRERLNFPPGKATLDSRDKIALDNLAEIIGDSPVSIEIRGHTSNLRVESDTYDNRQELSIGRARSVMNYLSKKKHIDQDQLSAKGFGAEKPLVPNTTPENRGINRRVDFFIREKQQTN